MRARKLANRDISGTACIMNGVTVVTRERLADFTKPAWLPRTTGGLCHSRVKMMGLLQTDEGTKAQQWHWII